MPGSRDSADSADGADGADAAGTPQPRVEVRRSARRRRTVDARREGDTVIVSIPASMSRAQERHWVEEMLRRLERSDARRRPGRRQGDDDLAGRAEALAVTHLDPIAPAGRWPRPASVRWVPAMRTRWASCTPADATIRVGERLREVPGWVLDYVLVHELVHLRVPGHGPDFHAAVGHYPRTERAVGYLEGLAAGAGLEMTED